MPSAATLTLTLANTRLTPPQPVLYVGQAADLTVTLTNDTGAALTLQAGSTPSTLDYYLPAALALLPGVATLCAGLAVPGWQAAPTPGSTTALRLTYTGQGGPGTTWAAQAAISFTLAGLTSSQTTPATGNLSVVPTNVSGANVPDQVFRPLSLAPAPPAGPVSLAGLLQVSLANAGLLYVSANATDALANILQLNIKNARQDGQGNPLPLYSGTTPWTSITPLPTPQISAWFVYGTDSGSLAPDDPLAAGSAWGIGLTIANDQAPGGWMPGGPVAATTISTPQGDSPPQWQLQAAADNLLLLGGNDDANLTVDFNHVVSVTPTGHTQLYLSFTGFWQDETTPYEPYFLALDIDKQTPSGLTRILQFTAPDTSAAEIVTVNDPVQPVSISFSWCVYNTANVTLATSMSEQPVYAPQYTANGGVIYDSYTLQLPANCSSRQLLVTLKAYDADGNDKDTAQLTFIIINQVFTDLGGALYPTIQVSSLLWMSRNLDYTTDGSTYFSGDASNAMPYGQLYTLNAALQSVPQGWRLPTSDDFNSLVSTFGGDLNLYAYAPLIAGGSSGFEGQLGGWACIPEGASALSYFDLSSSGYYWSSTPATSPIFSQTCLIFLTYTGGGQVDIDAADSVYGTDSSYSVRYVQNVDLEAIRKMRLVREKDGLAEPAGSPSNKID